jgi:hypothetical protein
VNGGKSRWQKIEQKTISLRNGKEKLGMKGTEENVNGI